MNKYDQERALCKENIKKCNEQIAQWRKKKSEWTARMENADKAEKLSLISRSGYDDPAKLAEKLGVKREEETDDGEKSKNASQEDSQKNTQNSSTSQSGQTPSSLTA